jgi:O-antigen ligase
MPARTSADRGIAKYAEISGFILLSACLFLFPFPRSWSLWPLAASMVCGLILILADPIRFIQNLVNRCSIVLPPVIYLLIYLTWFLFKQTPASLLEDKLMFGLVPVLTLPLFMAKRFWTWRRYFIMSYVAGIILISCFLLVRAIAESISLEEGKLVFSSFLAPGVSRFTWDQFSAFMHPTYFALSIIVAVSLLLFAWNGMQTGTLCRVSMILFLVLILFLLTVKASLLILVLLLVLFVTRTLNFKKSIMVLGFALPVFIGGLYLFAISNHRISSKINEIENRVFVEKVNWRDIDPRTKSWYSSATLISENLLLGVGPAARDTLVKRYQKLGYETEALFRLNSHNQYLETQLALGIPGTVTLFLIIAALLFAKMDQYNRKLRIPFLMIFLISMVFESILVRQAGIMLFVLAYCFITIPLPEKEKPA